MQTTTSKFLLSALVVAMAGCANYSGINSENTLRAPESLETRQSLQAQTSDWPTQQWWSDFGDAQLDSLMVEALNQSPSLETAAARVRAAQAYTGTARTPLYPQIDGSLNIQYQRFSENGIYPPPLGGSFD